jgi:L-alanine-DL-glutamate epimerase-like enolase superfamily enzyme
MDFQHLLEARAVDFIQPSSAKMGGLTELRKVFALADAHNATVMVHSFYDGPGLLANVHAISQQIAQLEDEAGVKLTERIGRRVRLTAAGNALVRHAERVMAVRDRQGYAC